MRYCEAQEGMRLAGADAMAAATLASAPVHAAARPRLRPLGACCAGRSSCALFSAPVHGKRISCLARERLRPFACFVCGRCCCCSVSQHATPPAPARRHCWGAAMFNQAETGKRRTLLPSTTDKAPEHLCSPAAAARGGRCLLPLLLLVGASQHPHHAR